MDEVGNLEEAAEHPTHYQISFFSTEERLRNLPYSVISVPSSSGEEEFNVLVNADAQILDDKWQTIFFEFLVGKILLRKSIGEFAVTNGLSGESVIQVECILRESIPKPDRDIAESDWVAGVKINSNRIFSVNYAGDLNMWDLEGKKLLTRKYDNAALKCLDVFGNYVIFGGQSQTITMCEIIENFNKNFELNCVAIYRGHERSVECLAMKNDGKRFVSGGFDSCLKVWDTTNNYKNDDDKIRSTGSENPKKARTSVQSVLPLVTLKSHREGVVGVKWNPLNETQVITVSWDHSIALWDLELSGTISTMSSNKPFSSLSINSTNGLIATGSADTVIRTWDLRSNEGSMVKSTFLGHTGWVSDLCWSPNAEHLFVSASFDKSVKMWDVRSTKAALYDLWGHRERVLTVDWSSTNLFSDQGSTASSTIASGSADKTIKTFTHSRQY